MEGALAWRAAIDLHLHFACASRRAPPQLAAGAFVRAFSANVMLLALSLFLFPQQTWAPLHSSPEHRFAQNLNLFPRVASTRVESCRVVSCRVVFCRCRSDSPQSARRRPKLLQKIYSDLLLPARRPHFAAAAAVAKSNICSRRISAAGGLPGRAAPSVSRRRRRHVRADRKLRNATWKHDGDGEKRRPIQQSRRRPVGAVVRHLSEQYCAASRALFASGAFARFCRPPHAFAWRRSAHAPLPPLRPTSVCAPFDLPPPLPIALPS